MATAGITIKGVLLLRFRRPHTDYAVYTLLTCPGLSISESPLLRGVDKLVVSSDKAVRGERATILRCARATVKGFFA